ncbi:apoptosis-antagonizing transcription factor [Coniella lustricola]|uniref:Protein BFR2 n=1 Tax=Coniella lustricola TaxID=2025994 RepID=A0A2T3AM51_9PEZI|nr:apoptosis-antagonizing transcription factor [Coniella lustricola]
MAPVAKKQTSRARQFAALDEKAVKDFDPEADGPAEDGASNGSDSEAEEDVAGTEHYVSVGKSKLRQKEAPALGPKYTGVRVSRAALDDSSDGESGQEESEEDDNDESDEGSEEFDDPDTADLERDNIIDDEEIDSDDALAEGEEEMFKKKGFTFKDSKSSVNKASSSKKEAPVANGRPKRMVAADLMSGSESAEEDDDDAVMDSGSEDGDAGASIDESGSEEDATGSSGEDESEDDSETDEDEDEDEEMDNGDDDDRSNLRKLVQDNQKGVISNISQAAKADAEKGVAVRQQRRSYDSLLNLRIRLQKGLVAVNSLTEVADSANQDDNKQPYEAAEEAAIKLWNAIDRFRASLLPEPKAGEKRKRDTQSMDSSIDEIWEDMQVDEKRATAKRNKILTKWSNKVKSSTATVTKERHLGVTATDSLVGALETQLLNPERLIKRAHVPRSCAPIQASKKVTEDAKIYDDADFYQLLLKELVDQRTNDAGGDADGNVPTVRWTAVKEAKTRKQVDRRASKGRKLRFTVHEKLQNFMAPENRKGWEEEAIDRLFGTLFGQRMQLKEDVSDDEDDDMAAAEEGLKLFRN